jgi:hypothetical protein
VRTSSSRVGRVALALALSAAAVTACSSSDDDDEASTTTTTAGVTVTTEEEGQTVTARAPEEITAPPAEGLGMNLPQPAAPTPDGYVVEELFVGGTATSYTVDDTPVDGRWAATPGDEAAYRTRVVVRRPAAAEDFSGTVIVEWFNVSAIEASPDWAFMADEITREGHAYVGVSVQAQGVEGGDTLLDVQVDPEQAAASGVSEASGNGLKNIDPARYGTLVHPGDAYAYDIFGQVGQAVVESPDALLGGLEVTSVIGAGESQSAAFLTTFVNAVHPLAPVYDGFLVHSRGGGAAPIDGDLLAARGGDNAEAFSRSGIRIRDDLDVPVFIFETETDLTLLGYANARQPDTDLIRTWEVAGLSHADAHFVRAIIGGPRDPSVGSFLGCTDPINVGPQHEVIQAALHHLVGWVGGGDPPPTGTPIELTDADDTTIARDERGIALGGVRHPLVDVPTAVLSGDPPGGGTIADVAGGGVCRLFGTTTALDPAALVELHGSADDYVAAFTASADATVTAGFLLRPDADTLVAEAEANRPLFG